MHAVSNSLLRTATFFLLLASLPLRGAVAADAKYSNPEYGYSLLLPNAAPRHESQPPAPQHGVAIDLPSGGIIWVDGSFDANFQGSAKAVLTQILEGAGGKVRRLPKQIKVANLDAASASYVKAKVVSIRVVAYRPRAPAVAVVYTFGLDTTRSQQRVDSKVFVEVVRGFSLESLPE